MDTNNWRNEDSRQKIVNKIMDTLRRHMPHRGPEGMNELNQIALRFEDKIYTQAASQKDYLQRISLKMLSLESKANQPSFPGGSPGNNQRPLDPGGMIPAQIRNQPQAPGNGLPLPGQPQPQQPLLQQNLQNNISAGGMPSSAGLAPPLSSIPMPGISHSSINNSTGQVLPSLLASNQRQLQSRQQQHQQQVVQQHQQSQSQQQKLLYQHQLQHQHAILKQKFQQQSQIQPSILQQQQLALPQSQPQPSQQSILQPGQQPGLQSTQQCIMQQSQPSILQPAQQSGLQQGQQSTIQQASQSVLQHHQQSILRQQQSQQSVIQQQQQASMVQQSILPQQQQHQQLLGQQNNVSNVQQQQQNQFQQLLQSKHQQTQQTSSSLLQSQSQQLQQQSQQQQLLSQLQSQSQPLQQQQSLLQQSNPTQQELQQRLQTTGGLLQQQQQQSSIEHQKQLLQQRGLSEASSTSMESSVQTGQSTVADWQDKVYQRLQNLKDMYHPEIEELYKKLSMKCRQPMLPDQSEKLKHYRNTLQRMMQYLQVPKSSIPPGFKEDKVDAFEKQIQAILNSFKQRKSAQQQQQGQQQLPNQSVSQVQSMQQQPQTKLSQMQQQEKLVNQLQQVNLQPSVTSMQLNTVTPIQHGSMPLQQSGVQTSQQNVRTTMQSAANLSSMQGTSVTTLQQNSVNHLQNNNITSLQLNNSPFQQNSISSLQQSGINCLQQNSINALQHHHQALKQQEILQAQLKMQQQRNIQHPLLQQQQQHQQGQQSTIQQASQSVLQHHQQSILGQQQSQQSVIQQQQQASMVQQSILPQQQQHQQLLGQQNNVSNVQQQQQNQFQQLLQSKHQQTQQTSSSLLQSQSQQLQQQSQQQQLLSQLQSQSQPLQQQQSLLQQSNPTQQELQQRLQTTGGLLQQQQQQSSIEHQKQLLQQRGLSEASSTSMESSVQTGQSTVADWQDKVYQRLQNLKDMYHPEIEELYKKLSMKCRQPMLPDQSEKLKHYRNTLQRMMQYLQVPKSSIPPGFKEDKVDAFEKQIQAILNSFKQRKSAQQQQQGQQQLPNQSVSQVQSMQQQPQTKLSQMQQQEKHVNQLQQMNLQPSVTSMQPNTVTPIQHGSMPLQQSGVQTSQQNVRTTMQSAANLSSMQGTSVTTLQQNSVNHLQNNNITSLQQNNSPFQQNSISSLQQSGINSLQQNSINALQHHHQALKQQEILQAQLKMQQQRNIQHPLLQQQQQQQQQQQLQQRQQQIQQQQQQKQQQAVQLQAEFQAQQMPQLQQINELNNDSRIKQSSIKQAFMQQHHQLSQRSVYQQQQQQLKTGSVLSVSSPQLLQAASPQVSQHSSPQIDQQSLVASSLQVPKVGTSVQPATSPFMAPSPSTLPLPSAHIEDSEKQSSAISSISNAGNAQGFQQTAPVLNHAQSLAIGTPGISTSPLLADFPPSPAQNTVNQDGQQTVSPGLQMGDKSSTTEPPLERLVKLINSMSPKALSSAVNDIGSVVSLIDRMAGSAPGNGSRAAAGEDLVAMTKCRLQARNLMSQDGSAATKRMRRCMSSMPLSTAASGGSVTNSLQQHNNVESPEMESTATSNIKRPRLEMSHALQDEIREINHQLIDTVVDVSEDGNDAAAAAAEGRDGIVLKCSYNAIALSPSMKFRYRSSQMTPISPLRLLIPENYPNSSPILLDRAPVEPCKKYEDLSSRAKANFHAAVRTLPQPMSLKVLAMNWDVCARSAVTEYAQQCGGGSFSSRFGAWESCANA